MNDSERPIISIVTSVFSGRERHIDICLESLTLSEFDRNKIELVVFLDYIDPSGAISILRKYIKKFRRIRCFIVLNKKDKIVHVSSRRNFLSLKSEGIYLLFIEPEMLHLGSTINLALNYISHNKNKNFWYCGPVYATEDIVNRYGDLVIYGKFYNIERINYFIDLAYRYRRDFGNIKTSKYFHIIDQKKFPPLFYCTLFEKSFFLKLGGLNQNLKIRGWEDIEFYNRFVKYGGKMLFDKDFITCHLPHKKSLLIEEQIGWNIYNSTVVFDPKQKIGNIPEKVKEIII